MANKTTAQTMNETERDRLITLLESSPLLAMADELAAYRNQLIKGGFKQYEAFLLVSELQNCLLSSIFPQPYYD